MTGDYMIQDQRVAARRPDVLVYQSEPLAADVTIAGPIQATHVRIDFRDRLGLGGQADRRLSRRLPERQTPTRRA